ncbi:BREX-2 system adenine-specific DNA-methyltransferase PglX [Streptomyces cathayae]|uniref:site-specific DNA-methyltransferase (adenine-specific) n=1 Tax=Streptomyces cathayae TaxID=3031124 RepID=A0ABY8JV19_9ACTN|nr:BREX-2 system adenine-specific DNA-methyltransferase PglX [Streptomyces sp. HUAS 5]WGD39507.1 BREX-2 system adenine-specific DNA-methyltransferase PglX [Streptomyces sp. HUAS 5]
MIDRKALLDDLKQQVKAVEADLGKQVKALDEVGARLKAEYDQARKLGRTAATWTSWLDERVTQVAVAWVLGTVFVRFCEDNRLIPEPYLTGPDGDRRELAESRYDAYVESDDNPTYRGWLEKAFDELGQGQAGRLLFDKRHNPLYQVPLSHDGARDLVEFWRGRNEAGVLVHDFTDPLNEDGTEGWDTRFLGDLYQDLSETARKTYALLQTPEFVEEFILDRTMDPAVREFGYEELKMIDPTCGSGHFVLGAFRRLVRLWGEGQPGKDVHERVAAALKSVHGVDVNPFAVAIARFRLLVAAMAAGGVRTLVEAANYEWPVRLAVGDSLIKSRRSQQGNLFGGVDEDFVDELAEFKYATEDSQDYPNILRPGRYHVVVGNPPYITVKDKKLNELYRDLYPACAGAYALSVPFAQRFFELAKRGDAEGRGFGMVGQITANSFMKREFGTKLIEGYFGHAVELTEVIDTSGAYIPGHGTPTVILVGKQRGGAGRSPVIRTVRSVQGEPAAPENAEEGLVWQAVVEQIDKPGSVSHWVSVDDLDRKKYFSKQPWILADGGLEMVEQLTAGAMGTLASVIDEIGAAAVTREDEAYMIGEGALRRHRIPCTHRRHLVEGGEVRDYAVSAPIMSLWPYKENGLAADAPVEMEKLLWPARRYLIGRVAFGKSQLQRGLEWFEYSMFFKRRYEAVQSIAFPFVSTHNHFVLNREKQVFIRTAPVIKLREDASEEEYLRLLGLLNSSTAGFWLRQVSHDKGRPGADVAGADEPWEHRFEFTGTKMEEFPIPSEFPLRFGTALDSLAQELATTSPSSIASNGAPNAASLREGREKWEAIRGRMVAIQEELDWQVYALYGLLDQEIIASAEDIPLVSPPERAFAIVLARKRERGEINTSWFGHHNHKFEPITEIPAHWPAPYREIVQKRIDVIEANRAIGMVERPEYKRRWATDGWDALQEKALRSWLLDRMENRDHWFDENGQPAILTLGRLTDALSRDDDFVSVAKLYAPRKDLSKVVAELITEDQVPFLSALRYKPSGLKKRADWEEVWDLQRKEDAAPDEPAKRKIRDSIPVPPKYTSADFLRPSYWKARGKLDVPKERFISYGQTNAATPELYGWAGWDHKEQAQALATYFTNTALSTEEITPFLAGLLELQPWLYQWHNEFDMLYSGSPADFFAGYRQTKQGEHGLTDDDLRNWRPPAVTRGRRAAAKH